MSANQVEGNVFDKIRWTVKRYAVERSLSVFPSKDCIDSVIFGEV